ncbi:hypothetical protein CSUI_008650 [Cystoisospora suis]|uniref:Transmembrane protein n=1 Tax=Cystoisospora suis TaxID=483139 RepID=A0A2C6KK74_9APIC|nr:hypothetical protein CSUI_008650 [Cystoisospora suis]
MWTEERKDSFPLLPSLPPSSPKSLLMKPLPLLSLGDLSSALLFFSSSFVIFLFVNRHFLSVSFFSLVCTYTSPSVYIHQDVYLDDDPVYF